MNIEEFNNLKKSKSIIIVDIRDAESYSQGCIPEAIHLNDGNIEKFIEDTDKSTPIVCCCYHGISSRGVANYLSENGFSEVYSLDGGFENWSSNNN